MSLMTSTEFDDFFRPYAGNVEGFYEAAYWKLSDEVVKGLVRRHLRPEPGGRLLDAGGGTGRWAVWCAEEFGADTTVADKSLHMLAEAKGVVAGSAAAHLVDLVHCDLEDARQLPDASYDYILSTYGVLSFLDDPAACFRTLFRVLKPGGRALLMSHSLATALSTKLGDADSAADVADLWRTRTVQWAPRVPRLRVFTSADLTELAHGAGFTTQAVFGITSTVQPGPEDFGYPYREISAISRKLEDPAYFDKVLQAELAAAEQPHWSERGTNLMIYVSREQ
jgi:ubiquinone/menaquinone biosynthesis C-methylase UbiE